MPRCGAFVPWGLCWSAGLSISWLRTPCWILFFSSTFHVSIKSATVYCSYVNLCRKTNVGACACRYSLLSFCVQVEPLDRICRIVGIYLSFLVLSSLQYTSDSVWRCGTPGAVVFGELFHVTWPFRSFFISCIKFSHLPLLLETGLDPEQTAMAIVTSLVGKFYFALAMRR